MRVPADLDVGAATHTGVVRHTNEDDFLLVLPEEIGELRLAVVADGMGGVAGGAEASRTAVRAVAEAFVGTTTNGDWSTVMRDAFAAACQRVFELSMESPGLRGMGTTLTVAALHGRRLVLGHVGDSRCYRLRRGDLEQLTTDHVVAGQNRLTRCVGGGREAEDPDVAELELEEGDRLLLATDGLWDSIETAQLAQVLGQRDPQAAAAELVRLAHAQGGRDNCTAVVVEAVRRTEAHREVLPTEELELSPRLPRVAPLRRPTWPWWILGLSALLVGLAVLRRFYDIDLLFGLLGGG